MASLNKKEKDFINKINNQELEVISLMNKGWELGKSAITGRYWAQAEGLSSGKPTLNVEERVVDQLLSKGKIFVARDDPRLPTLYQLKK